MSLRAFKRLLWSTVILCVSYDVVAGHYIPSYCGSQASDRTLLQVGQVVASLGGSLAAGLAFTLSRKRVVLAMGLLGFAAFFVTLPLFVFGGSACGSGDWLEDVPFFALLFGGLSLAAGAFLAFLVRAALAAGTMAAGPSSAGGVGASAKAHNRVRLARGATVFAVTLLALLLVWLVALVLVLSWGGDTTASRSFAFSLILLLLVGAVTAYLASRSAG